LTRLELVSEKFPEIVSLGIRKNSLDALACIRREVVPES
jgi:hypothetical protein